MESFVKMSFILKIVITTPEYQHDAQRKFGDKEHARHCKTGVTNLIAERLRPIKPEMSRRSHDSKVTQGESTIASHW